jgi:hypothetical protein
MSDSEPRHSLFVCPLCDYALVGLPAEGICPECGQGYGATEMFLYGNALGSRRNAWNNYNRKPAPIIGSLIVLAVTAYLIILPHNVSLLRDPLVFVCLGLSSLSIILGLWRGFTDQGSGVVQVRLAPLGVRQGTRGIGPLPYERNARDKLIPWNKIKEAELNWRDSYGEIRLSNSKTFWRLRPYREFVHANFSSNIEHFEQVKNYLRYWLAKNNCADAIDFLEHQRRPIHRLSRRVGASLHGRAQPTSQESRGQT